MPGISGIKAVITGKAEKGKAVRTGKAEISKAVITGKAEKR